MACVDQRRYAGKRLYLRNQRIKIAGVAPRGIVAPLPVKHDKRFAKVAFNAVGEVLRFRVNASAVNVVVNANQKPAFHRLLHLPVTIRRNVACALRRFADRKINGKGIKIDAILPIANVNAL